MLSSKGKSYDGFGKVSFDAVFLRGTAEENLNSIYRLVEDITQKLPAKETQIWIENPEFIRLWNIPSNTLISSYNNQVFIEDECLIFRKQNHAHYLFEQHYQITVVCPKDRVQEATKLIDDFCEKVALGGAAIIKPLHQTSQRSRQYCSS